MSHVFKNREWHDLIGMQEKYLIQIRPPGDVMPEAFRELVMKQQATNVAILYDDTFGKTKHWRQKQMGFICYEILYWYFISHVYVCHLNLF